MNDSEQYCTTLLRSSDYDRYIALLFAPRDKRGALAALYAFHLEIARIGDTIKEPLAGEIRLRWWHDRLEAGPGAGQSPVSMALLAAIRRFNLPVPALQRMCDAHIFDLYHDAMPGQTELEGYYGETTSLVIQLACQIIDSKAASLCADACGHGGVAQGIANLLQQLSVTTARDQLYIPDNILTAVGTTRAALRAAVPDQQARLRVLMAMLALGRDHYRAFVAAFAKVPAPLRPAFLPLAPLPAFFNCAEALGSQVFEQRAQLSRLRRHYLILRAALTGKFNEKA